MTPFTLEYTKELSALRGESRSAVRFPMHSFLRVCWFDQHGTAHHVMAQGLNLSATGIAFMLEEPLPVPTMLQLELPAGRLTAIANARSCEPIDTSWRIGVELEGPFTSVC
ncbi:MAG TPA: PilZ domain-containing protein [Bryobacteraceae bacterium]|nr:PilZ domain-containing protein [Bryobacteraceae bacterium]